MTMIREFVIRGVTMPYVSLYKLMSGVQSKSHLHSGLSMSVGGMRS
jgi:hypothetical protein